MFEFLKIDDVLDNITLGENMLGAEFGCGSAVFAVKLARRLHKGKVYALDIQEEKLSALKGRLAHEKISNVDTILCDLEVIGGSTLQDDFLDIVLIPNVLFQVDDKHAMIQEAKRVLKKGGQLLIIDWLKKGSFSPKETLLSPEEVKKISEELGLAFKKEFVSGDFHYALLFIK